MLLLIFVLLGTLAFCECWQFSVSQRLVTDKLTYQQLNPQPSAIDSNFLCKLADAKLTRLSKEISVIDLGAPVDLDGISQSRVFVRSMYNGLLQAIRESKRTVLIGNPGTSKSFFQYYYLARLMCPQLFDPLPPDWNGSSVRPSVVIRQMGNEGMTIYDLNSKTADTIEGSRKKLLTCFDPQSTLYLHEPDSSRDEPLFRRHQVPLLSTVSPDRMRYKECVKGGAAMVFMPTYTQEELVTIASFLQAQGETPKGVSYSKYSVKERFKRYGGIIRHVIPTGVDAVTLAARDQEAALAEADASALLRSGNIELPEISHFLVQYKVAQEGEDKFRSYSIDVANRYVRERLQEKFDARSLEERRLTLIRNDDTGFMETECERLYEGALADSLTVNGGVTWRRRRADFFPATSGRKRAVPTAAGSDWEEFSLSLKRVERSAAPNFADLEEGVIYQPTEKNYPAVDFIFKSGKGVLVGVQVTRMQTKAAKKVKAGAVLDLLARLGLTAADASKLELVLVPRPKMQATARLSLVDSERAQTDQACTPTGGASPALMAQKQHKEKKKPRREKTLVSAVELGLRQYTVWGVPSDYGRTWVKHK